MTAAQDWLVGGMAVAVGALLVAGALFDSAQLMQLAKSRLLVDAVGKRAARVMLAAIGFGAIVLGVLIASGWRVEW